MQGPHRSLGVVDNLFYFSVDGVQIAAAKNILGTDGGAIFPFAPPGQMDRMAQFAVPAPNGVVVTIILFAVCALAVFIAWTRVRAVEVVG